MLKVFASSDHGCQTHYESEHMTPGECSNDEFTDATGFNSFWYDFYQGTTGENRQCWFRVYEQKNCLGAAQDFPPVGSEHNTCHEVFGKTNKLGRSMKLICEYKCPPQEPKYTTYVTSDIVNTYTTTSVYYSTTPTTETVTIDPTRYY